MDEHAKGALYGILAYGLWGVFPLYFKAISMAPALEILARRIFWSFLVLLVLVVATRRVEAIRALLRDRRAALLLCASTVMIATNWLLFVIAVTTGRILESSLGYFINPLVNILLEGAIPLGTAAGRTKGQRGPCGGRGRTHDGAPRDGALDLDCAGRDLPLLRPVPENGLRRGSRGPHLRDGNPRPRGRPLHHLGAFSGNGAFLTGSTWLDRLLPLSGIITAFPLLAFGAAARRVRLTTLGFLQYISPAGHFLLAVYIFGEPFGKGELAAFLLIWSGLAIYSADTVWEFRKPVASLT